MSDLIAITYEDERTAFDALEKLGELQKLQLIELADALPADRVRVAESGIKDHGDIVRLTEAGYDAFLIGETLVRSADPARAVAELAGR